MSGYEMISREILDKTTMVSYLSQFYELFRKESVERDAGENHYMLCYCCRSIETAKQMNLPLIRK